MASFAPSTRHQLATISCCECGASITANAANLCGSCAGARFDLATPIHAHLAKNARLTEVLQCGGCERWLDGTVERAHWVDAPLESAELLALVSSYIRSVFSYQEFIYSLSTMSEFSV